MRIGQRVAAFPADDSFADVVVAPAVSTYALDDAIADEDADSILMLVTAYNMGGADSPR